MVRILKKKKKLSVTENNKIIRLSQTLHSSFHAKNWRSNGDSLVRSTDIRRRLAGEQYCHDEDQKTMKTTFWKKQENERIKRLF